MALKPQYINISVAGGLDTKTDRKIVRPPQTLVANNVRYVTAGSVRKRYGLNFLPQPGTANASNVSSLGSTNTELLATDASYMYAYSPGGQAWANRGTAPQTSLDVKTIGSYQLPLANSLTAPTQQVRQLTYDVIGNVGLAAWDTGDFVDSSNINYLGSIVLCLFDTVTGKAIWKTTIAKPYLAPLGGTVTMGLWPTPQTPVQLPQTVTNTFTSQGAGYPVIRAFKGQFFLTYTATANMFYTASGGVKTGAALYYVQMLRLNPADLPTKMPVINANTITNATLLMNGPAATVAQPPTSPLYPTVSPPLWLDVATNGFDLTLLANGQSYTPNAVTSQNPTPSFSSNGSPSGYIAAFTDATSNAPNKTRAQLSLPAPSGSSTSVAQVVTLAPTPQGNTLSSDASYVAAYKYGIQIFQAPSRSTFTTSAISASYAYALGMANSEPIDAYVLGTPGSGQYDVHVTDGVYYNRLLAYNNATQLTSNTQGAVKVDYSRALTNVVATANAYAATAGPVLQSRIFQAPDGQPVAWVMLQGYTSTSFNCLALVNIGEAVTPASVYAHAFYLRAGVSLIGRQACNASNNGILAYQLTDVANQVAAIKWVTVSNTPAPQIAKLNQGALLTGADTKYYDGQSVRTLGWLKFPEFPYMLGDGSGGQLVSGTAYSYVAVWVDYDAYGNAIYSSPSPVCYLNGATSAADVTAINTTFTSTAGSNKLTNVSKPELLSAGQTVYGGNGIPDNTIIKAISGSTVTISNNATITNSSNAAVFSYPSPKLRSGQNATAIYVSDYNASMAPSRGQLLLYRNSSKDLLTYRRIPPLTLGFVSPDFPIPRYVDMSPDDNTANPQLYSQPNGGELPNDPPPASNYAVTTLRRPFVASAENPSWLYFGKPYFPGRPCEFNALQFLDIDPPSGDITGLAVLDQNVIIFKKERIFVLSGDGPDATGAGTFNNTYAVATDTGCLDPKSIVSTESGVYFRSIRGIQLLARDLSVSYIGAPVENLIAQSIITSAVLVPGQNQIRFALDSYDPLIDGKAADNVILVYDYFLQKWSTYGLNPTSDPRYSLKLIGQATWQNNWFGLAGNAVFQDASPNATGGPVQFTDGMRLDTTSGAPVNVPIQVNMDVETGWIPLAGQQGIGRLRWITVLGDFKSANTLRLWIAFDYNDAYPYHVDFTPSDGLTAIDPPPAAVSGDPQQWRIRSPRQVGQAVKFKLTDSSTGEACVITGLLLETYQKSGASRLPDYASV